MDFLIVSSFFPLFYYRQHKIEKCLFGCPSVPLWYLLRSSLRRGALPLAPVPALGCLTQSLLSFFALFLFTVHGFSWESFHTIGLEPLSLHRFLSPIFFSTSQYPPFPLKIVLVLSRFWSYPSTSQTPSRFSFFSLPMQLSVLVFMIYQVQVLLPSYFRMRGSPLGSGSLTRGYTAREIWQWQRLLGGRGGTSCPLPFSMLGFSLAWACPSLAHVMATTVSSCVQLPCCGFPGKLPVVFQHLCILPSFHPPFGDDPWVSRSSQ